MSFLRGGERLGGVLERLCGVFVCGLVVLFAVVSRRGKVSMSRLLMILGGFLVGITGHLNLLLC
jgi:hypothetical protein